MMRLAFLVSIAAGLSTPRFAAAQTTYTWNTAATGTIAWGTPADWTGGSTYPGSSTGIFDTATFSTLFIPTAPINLTLGTIYLNAINFNQTNNAFAYTLSAGTINLGGTTPTITVKTAGVTEVINSVIAGTTLTKAGAGALTLSGANTYSGGTTLSAGELNINSNSAIGTGALAIAAGTTIDNTSSLLVTLGTNAQTWNGSFTFGGSNALNLGTGTVTLGTSVTVTVNGASALTVGGAISGGSNSLTVASSSGGALTLNGAATFSSASATTVSGGTLSIGSAASLTTGFLTVGVNGGSSPSSMTLNGGTITVNGSSTGAGATAVFSVGGQSFSGASAALSTFTVNSGTLNINVSSSSSFGAAVGQASGNSTATAIFNQAGGTVNYSPGANAPYFSIGNGTGAASMKISGGTFTASANSKSLIVGTRGNGTFTVSGPGVFSEAFGNVSVGYGGATTGAGVASVVNLGDGAAFSGGTSISNGGTSGLLITTEIGMDIIGGASSASTTGAVNFNGGTLRAAAANTTFIPSSSSFTVAVQAAGGIIDNNSFAISIPQAITSGVGSGSDGGLVFKGGGVTTLTGANSFTGPTVIQAGIVNYQNGAALGTTSAITVASGATAQIQGGIAGGGLGMTISGSGASGAAGALESVAGTNSYAGSITLGANATIAADSSSALALTNTGTIVGGGFNLTLTGDGAGSISSVINTTIASVTKSGTGAWALTASNTYTGATKINAGTLILSAGTTQASPYTVSNGAVFSISSPSAPTSTARLLSNLTFGSVLADTTTLNLLPAADWTTSSPTLLSVGGTLTANGGANSTTINVATPAEMVVGIYNLIGYSGSLGGTGFGAFTLGALSTPRTTASLLNSGSAIQLDITLIDSPKWTGAINGVWDINNTVNWQLIDAGTQTGYLQKDNVIFDDSATGTTSISLNVSVTPYTVTFSNNAKAYSISGNGAISGAVSVTISGGGVVSLATNNTYTGGTFLSNYSHLNINSSSAIGTGPLTIAAGTIDNTSGGSITLATNNIQNWNGNVAFGGGNPLNLGTGAVTLGQSVSVTVNGTSNPLTVGGAIGDGSNGYRLTLAGTGTLILTGSNTYTGGTTISGGALQIGNGSGAGSILGNVLNNGTLVFNLSSNVVFGGVVSGSGSIVQAGLGMLTLTGPNTYTGATTISSGILNAGATETAGVSGPFGAGGPIVFAGGILQFSAANNSDYSSRFSTNANQAINIDTNGQTVAFASAIVSAGGTLTKLGAGPLTLSGNSSYSGGTVLSAGQLNINAGGTGASNSAIGTGTLTIAADTTISNTSGSTVSLATNNAENWNGNFSFGGNNPLNLGTGPVTMATNVTLRLNGASPLTVGGGIGDGGHGYSLTMTAAANGTLTLNGVNTYSGATTVNSGNLVVGPTASIATTTLTVGINGGTATSSLTLNGGAITVSAAPFSIGGTSFSGATTPLSTVTVNSGAFTVTGSQFIVGNGLLNGTASALIGQFIQTGGAVNFSPSAASVNFILSNGTGASAMTVSGGTYTGSANSTLVTVGARGNATLTVAGGGIFNEAFGNISLGNSSSSTPASVVSTVNLGDGVNFTSGTSVLSGTSGILVAKLVGKDLQGTGGSNTAVLNFNGGTLQASASSTASGPGSSFITVDSANVLAGGGIIDNAGFAITISQPLVSGAPTDGGLLFISSTGAGATTLTAASNYNGGTTVWSGTLAAGASGTVFGTGAVTLNPAAGNTATLSTGSGPREVLINGLILGGQSNASQSLVTGTTAFNLGSSSAITFVGTNNPLGAVISAPIDLNGTTNVFTIGVTPTSLVGLTVSGQIIDSIGGATLVITGPGVLAFTSAGNTYSGATNIMTGTLVANNAGGSATGTGNVYVGGTLAGIGSIVPGPGNSVTVNNGGTIRGGVSDSVNNWGTLSIGSNLTINAGGTITTEVIRTDANQVNAGLINISSSSAAIFSLGTATAHLGGPGFLVNINVIDTNATLVVGETYTINLVQAYQANPSSPTTTNFQLNGNMLAAGATVDSSLQPSKIVLIPPGGKSYINFLTQNNPTFAANTGWSLGVSANGELLQLTLLPEFRWIGAVSSLWNAGSNWSSGMVPVSGMIASFNQPASPHTTVSLGNSTQPIASVLFETGAASYTLGNAASDAFLFDPNGTVAVTSAVANVETVNAAIKTQGAFNIANDGTGGLTFNGAFTLGGGTAGLLTFSGTGTTKYVGSISTGANSLLQAGPGTVILSGNNSYVGTTTISSGATLIASNTSGSATGSSNVIVNGTLAGTGSIVPVGANSVTVNNGATIRGGVADSINNWSTLSVGSNLTVNAGSAITTEVIRTAVNQVNASLINISGSQTAIFSLGSAASPLGGAASLVTINLKDTFSTLALAETYSINLVQAYQANPASPTTTNFQLNGNAIAAGTTVTSSLQPLGGVMFINNLTQNNATVAANTGWSVGVSPDGQFLQLTLVPEFHWTGAVSALWTTTGNWSAGIVPIGGMIASFNQPASPNTTVSLGGAVQPIGSILFETAAAAYTLGNGAADGFLFGANGTVSVTSAVAKLETIAAAVETQGPFNIINYGTGGLMFSGSLTSGGGTAGLLTFSGTGTTTYAGSISNGVNGLTQAGPGTVILSGSNSYIGTTTISGGVLIANNTSGSATGTGNVVVNGTLAGIGSITTGAGNNVTVNSGGTIRGGVADGVNNWGVLAINNNVIISSGVTLLTEVNRMAANQANASLINLSNSQTAILSLGTSIAHVGGAGNLINLNILDTTATLMVGEAYTIDLVQAYQANPMGPTATNFQLNGNMIGAGTIIDSGYSLSSHFHSPIVNLVVSNNAPFASSNPGWALSVSADGQFLQLTLAPGNYWTGAMSALWTAAGNWSSGAVPVSGNTALFNQATSPNTTVGLSGAAQPIGAIVFDTAAAAYTIGTGGADALLFDANASIIVTGAVANPQTFNAIIQTQGALNITNNGTSTTGGLKFNGALTLGGSAAGTLTFSGTGTTTYAGNIATGVNGLVQMGPGAVVLSGVNSYIGGTTILGGTLKINGDSALGAAAGVVNLNGGELQFFPSGGVTLNITRGIVLGGGAFDTNFGNDTINGVISGNNLANSNLIKIGAGDLVLNNVNTYAGSTTVNAGFLIVSSTGSLASGPLIVNNSNSAFPGTQVGLELFNAAQTVGPLSGAIAQPGVGNTAAIFLSATTTLTVNQTAAGTFQGTIFGSGNLVLGSSSNSTLTLTGNSTYTGYTTINSGTIQLGATGGPAVTNVLPATTSLTFAMGSTLNLNNNNQTTAALVSGSAGNINTGAGTGGILTIGNTAGGTVTYSGVISGTGGLTWGIINTNVPNPTPSTLVLTNASTNTGPTTINSGTLSIGTAYALSGGVAPVLPYNVANSYPGAFTLGPTATLLTNGFNLTVGSLGGGGPIGGNISLGNNSSSTLYIVQSLVQSSSTGYAGIISGTGNVYIVNGINLAVYGNWTLTGGVTHDVTPLVGNHSDSPQSYLPFAVSGSAVTTQGIEFAGFTDQVSTIYGGSAGDNNGKGTFVDATGDGGKLVLSCYAATVANGGPANGSGGTQNFSGFFANDVGLIVDAGYFGNAQQLTLSGPNNTTGPLTIGFTNQTTPQNGAATGAQSGVMNQIIISATSTFGAVTVGNLAVSNLINNLTVQPTGNLTAASVTIGDAFLGSTGNNSVTVGGTLTAGSVSIGNTNLYGTNVLTILSTGTVKASAITIGNDFATVTGALGTLNVNGALGTSSAPIAGLAVQAGGVLEGYGTITGSNAVSNVINVTNGTIRGGFDDGTNQLGTLTIAANSGATARTVLAIQGSGSSGHGQTGALETEVLATSSTAATNSKINITGTNNGMNLNTLKGGNSAGQINIVLYDPTASLTPGGPGGATYTFVLATVATAGRIQLGGANQAAGTLIDTGATLGAGSGTMTNADLYIQGASQTYTNAVTSWSLFIDSTGKNLELSVTSATPEPEHILLMCVGVLLAGFAIRRRWQQQMRSAAWVKPRTALSP